MSGNKKTTLENQITSMLNQMLNEEKGDEDQLFFSDEENEKDETNENNIIINNQKKKRVCFNDDNYNKNDNNIYYNNNFIRKNQRNDKKFQTVNVFNNNVPHNNPLLSHRNYFHTQIIHNNFNFNNNLINQIPNNNYVFPNFMMNNLNNPNNNYNSQNNLPTIFKSNFHRDERRKKTYDGKNYDIQIENNLSDKKFGSVVFPKETNLKAEIALYELKNILHKADKIDHFIYSKIQGNFVNIIKTHKGSRIFQNYLKNTHSDILHQIFIEVNPYLKELLIDPYANYFCRKFFTFLNQKDKTDFLLSIENSLIKLSTNSIGTYPIQGIIEHIGSKIEKNIIINAIKDHIEELSFDPYSSHVIEKILSCFEEEYISFIYDYISQNFLKLAYNANGICLVKKIITFTHKIKIHEQIKNIVEENSMDLIKHPYGNYVIQVLVDNWDLPEVKQILKLYDKQFTSLSMEKYSSNVMERCIEKSDDILSQYIDEVCESGKIFEVMKNNFGNYVIQKALRLCSGNDRRKLVIEVSKNIYKLNDKKLIAKWKNLIMPHLETLKIEENILLSKKGNLNEKNKENNVNNF